MNATVKPPAALGISPKAIAGTTMKAVQMYSPYGYRGKVGLILPSTNTVIEPEFNQMAPKGVSIHSGRIMLLGKASEESYRAMGDATARAAAELATAEPDVIAWGCTSGSCVVPRETLEGSIVSNSGIQAVSTMTAVFEALQAFGVKTISLGTLTWTSSTRPKLRYWSVKVSRLLLGTGWNWVRHRKSGAVSAACARIPLSLGPLCRPTGKRVDLPELHQPRDYRHARRFGEGTGQASYFQQPGDVLGFVAPHRHPGSHRRLR